MIFFLNYFRSKHTLLVYVLTRMFVCFGSNISYTLKTPAFLKVGFNVVYIARACFPDVRVRHFGTYGPKTLCNELPMSYCPADKHVVWNG